MFYDTSLTIDPDYTKELFKKMKRLKKKFFCNGNVDVLAQDKELIRLSKEAGCLAWLVGFESFCQDTLNQIRKTTNTVDEYAQAVKNIHSQKMVVIGEFIFGFDNDTSEVFEKTLSMIRYLEIDVTDFSILTPFPGTPLFKKLDTQGRILTKDWKFYNMRHAVFQPTHMTPKELEEGVQRVSREFYSTPMTIKRVVRSLRWGFPSFFVVLTRNLIAMRSRR
jgi:radical SAM superfamily enzyme YgiQ (UPF0313 family)